MKFMKWILVALFLGIGALPLHAQTKVEQPIKVTSSFWGLSLEQGGQNISLKEAENIMQSVPKAMQSMKKARTNNTIASILGVAGGAAIGWPLGTAAGGGHPKWFLAGIGAGLIVAAIPFSISTTKQAKKAASFYNKSIPETSKHQWNIKMGFSGKRLSVVFTF